MSDIGEHVFIINNIIDTSVDADDVDGITPLEPRRSVTDSILDIRALHEDYDGDVHTYAARLSCVLDNINIEEFDCLLSAEESWIQMRIDILRHCALMIHSARNTGGQCND